MEKVFNWIVSLGNSMRDIFNFLFTTYEITEGVFITPIYFVFGGAIIISIIISVIRAII